MRIGVNALYLIPGSVGGTEIYFRQLLNALSTIGHDHEFFIFANTETAADLLAPAPNFYIHRCAVSASLRPLRILYEQIVLPLLLEKYRIDVVFNPGFTAPILSSRPSVTVFHDLQNKRHPEFFRWFDLPFWNLLLGLSAWRSRSLIAVSASTADDLRRYMPHTKDKIAVVAHGVDSEFRLIGHRRTAAAPAADPFILTVSTLHPHKNLDRLLEAFRIFRTSRPDYRLIVAGLKGFVAGKLEAQRQETGLSEAVTFTGWISQAELYGLYERASAFIAPSLFEGFGMPVLEALAAGIPTACSSIAVFDPLVCPATQRFDPLSTSEIAEALERITSDSELRSRSTVEGPAHAASFDWNNTAQLTLQELERAAD